MWNRGSDWRSNQFSSTNAPHFNLPSSPIQQFLDQARSQAQAGHQRLIPGNGLPREGTQASFRNSSFASDDWQRDQRERQASRSHHIGHDHFYRQDRVHSDHATSRYDDAATHQWRSSFDNGMPRLLTEAATPGSLPGGDYRLRDVRGRTEKRMDSVTQRNRWHEEARRREEAFIEKNQGVAPRDIPERQEGFSRQGHLHADNQMLVRSRDSGYSEDQCWRGQPNLSRDVNRHEYDPAQASRVPEGTVIKEERLGYGDRSLRIQPNTAFADVSESPASFSQAERIAPEWGSQNVPLAPKPHVPPSFFTPGVAVGRAKKIKGRRPSKKIRRARERKRQQGLDLELTQDIDQETPNTAHLYSEHPQQLPVQHSMSLQILAPGFTPDAGQGHRPSSVDPTQDVCHGKQPNFRDLDQPEAFERHHGSNDCEESDDDFENLIARYQLIKQTLDVINHRERQEAANLAETKDIATAALDETERLLNEEIDIGLSSSGHKAGTHNADIGQSTDLQSVKEKNGTMHLPEEAKTAKMKMVPTGRTADVSDERMNKKGSPGVTRRRCRGGRAVRKRARNAKEIKVDRELPPAMCTRAQSVKNIVTMVQASEKCVEQCKEGEHLPSEGSDVSSGSQFKPFRILGKRATAKQPFGTDPCADEISQSSPLSSVEHAPLSSKAQMQLSKGKGNVTKNSASREQLTTAIPPRAKPSDVTPPVLDKRALIRQKRRDKRRRQRERRIQTLTAQAELDQSPHCSLRLRSSTSTSSSALSSPTSIKARGGLSLKATSPTQHHPSLAASPARSKEVPGGENSMITASSTNLSDSGKVTGSPSRSDPEEGNDDESLMAMRQRLLQSLSNQRAQKTDEVTSSSFPGSPTTAPADAQPKLTALKAQSTSGVGANSVPSPLMQNQQGRGGAATPPVVGAAVVPSLSLVAPRQEPVIINLGESSESDFEEEEELVGAGHSLSTVPLLSKLSTNPRGAVGAMLKQLRRESECASGRGSSGRVSGRSSPVTPLSTCKELQKDNATPPPPTPDFVHKLPPDKLEEYRQLKAEIARRERTQSKRKADSQAKRSLKPRMDAEGRPPESPRLGAHAESVTSEKLTSSASATISGESFESVDGASVTSAFGETIAITLSGGEMSRNTSTVVDIDAKLPLSVSETDRQTSSTLSADIEALPSGDDVLIGDLTKSAPACVDGKASVVFSSVCEEHTPVSSPNIASPTLPADLNVRAKSSPASANTEIAAMPAPSVVIVTPPVQSDVRDSAFNVCEISANASEGNSNVTNSPELSSDDSPLELCNFVKTSALPCGVDKRPSVVAFVDESPQQTQEPAPDQVSPNTAGDASGQLEWPDVNSLSPASTTNASGKSILSVEERQAICNDCWSVIQSDQQELGSLQSELLKRKQVLDKAAKKVEKRKKLLMAAQKVYKDVAKWVNELNSQMIELTVGLAAKKRKLAHLEEDLFRARALLSHQSSSLPSTVSSQLPSQANSSQEQLQGMIGRKRSHPDDCLLPDTDAVSPCDVAFLPPAAKRMRPSFDFPLPGKQASVQGDQEKMERVEEQGTQAQDKPAALHSPLKHGKHPTSTTKVTAGKLSQLRQDQRVAERQLPNCEDALRELLALSCSAVDCVNGWGSRLVIRNNLDEPVIKQEAVVCPKKDIDNGSNTADVCLPYCTPLQMFRAYRLTDAFMADKQLKLTSQSFSNSLLHQRTVCQFDLLGTCNDQKCPWQHVSKCGLSGTAVIKDVASYKAEFCVECVGDVDGPSKTTLQVLDEYVSRLNSAHKGKLSDEQLCSLVAERIRHQQPKEDGKSILFTHRCWQPTNQITSCAAPEDTSQSGPKDIPSSSELLSHQATLVDLDSAASVQCQRYFDLAVSHEDKVKLHEASLEASPQDVNMWLSLAGLMAEKSTSIDDGRCAALHVISRALEHNQKCEVLWLRYLSLYSQDCSDADLHSICEQAIEHCASFATYWKFFALARTYQMKVQIGRRVLVWLLENDSSGCMEESSHELLQVVLCLAQLDMLTGNKESAEHRLQHALEGNTQLKARTCPYIAKHLTASDLCLAWLCLIHFMECSTLPSQLFDTAASPTHIVCKDPFIIPWPEGHPLCSNSILMKLFKEALQACRQASHDATDYLPLYKNMVAMTCSKSQESRWDAARKSMEVVLKSERRGSTVALWLVVTEIAARQAADVLEVFRDALSACQAVSLYYQAAKWALKQACKQSAVDLLVECVLQCCLPKEADDELKQKEPLLLMHAALGITLPYDSNINSSVFNHLSDNDRAQLWLCYCLWTECDDSIASRLQDVTDIDGSSEATFEAALRHLNGSVHEQLIWREYLLHHKHRLSSPHHADASSKALAVLTFRCLAAVSPQRSGPPGSGVDRWLDYRFHNEVIDIYTSCLTAQDRLLVFDRLVSTFPHNTALALRAAQLALYQKPRCMEQARSFLATALANQPTCLPLWKIAIQLELFIGNIKEARWMYREATQAIPFAAALWRDYLLFELTHQGHKGHSVLTAIDKTCRRRGVSIKSVLAPRFM